MKEQPTGPRLVMIKTITVIVVADMDILEPGLAVAYINPPLSQIDLSRPQGFHLGTQQGYPCFEAVAYFIVMKGLSVFAYDFDAHILYFICWRGMFT